jgi:hypothetical protein
VITSKVERYSNWCSIDRLDGDDLQNGEMLKLVWPDGSISTETITVEKTTFEVYDHGHSYGAPQSHAFVQTEVHGQPVKLHIVGLFAKRV